MLADVEMNSVMSDDSPYTPTKNVAPSTPRASTTKLVAPPQAPCMSDHDAMDCHQSVKGEVIPLCVDQGDWLALIASRYALSNVSDVLCRLVVRANAEPPKAKKHIFLMVRCHRCLQHTRGGDKRDFSIELPAHQWLWLEGVRERCSHSSTAKTLRIIVDFYKQHCEADAAFERALLNVA